MIEEMIEYYFDEENTKEVIRNDIESLLARCDSANIKYSLEEAPFLENQKYLMISFPSGREKHQHHCFSIQQIRDLLEIQFESKHFLAGYKGIYSYESSVIECLITSLNIISVRQIFSRLFELNPSEIEDEKIEESVFTVERNNIKISLSVPSKDMMILFPANNSRRSLSLKIEGVNISKHDEVMKTLETMTNSFFFQIDICKNISFILQKTRIRNREELVSWRKRSKPIEFPKYEYDAAPLSLYWYGRSAVHMPLLQYLSFYQAIEYYFPAYFHDEVKKKFQTLLKDPSFRVDRESDITKLIKISQFNNGGYGNEREMLKVTIKACIEETELRDVLSGTEDIKKHFTTKLKGITDCTINFSSDKIDLRDMITQRVYDIRCKIVHAKNDSDEIFGSFLLPFSNESEMLQLDIDLIQLIAQKVIIASSSIIKIEI